MNLDVDELIVIGLTGIARRRVDHDSLFPGVLDFAVLESDVVGDGERSVRRGDENGRGCRPRRIEDQAVHNNVGGVVVLDFDHVLSGTGSENHFFSWTGCHGDWAFPRGARRNRVPQGFGVSAAADV